MQSSFQMNIGFVVLVYKLINLVYDSSFNKKKINLYSRFKLIEQYKKSRFAGKADRDVIKRCQQ